MTRVNMRVFLRITSCFLLFLTANCSKGDSVQPIEEEPPPVVEVQLPKAESLAVFGGDGRVKMSWYLEDDSEVDYYKVSWYNNTRSNSITERVSQKKGKQLFEIIVNDIEEGTYLFEVQMFDENDNASKKTSVTGEVYGGSYQKDLRNYGCEIVQNLEDEIVLKWKDLPVDTEHIGFKVKYKDQNNKAHSFFIKDPNSDNTIKSIHSDGVFEYQAAYLPFPLALDTIYSDSNLGVATDNYTVSQFYDSESNTEYFLTRIKHKDKTGGINRLRLDLKDPSKDKGEISTDFAQRKNATLVFNASMGTTETLPSGQEQGVAAGVQIVDGVIKQDRQPRQRWNYALGIKADNELVAYPSTKTAQEILEDGAVDAATAFVPIIENHLSKSESELEALGPPNLLVKHPRQVVGQFDNLDIIFLTTGGRTFGGDGMTAMEVIRIMENIGVKFAYNLDGGGSTSTVVKGRFINWKIDNQGKSERPRWNFLYLK